jgi:hypothetical protein
LPSNQEQLLCGGVFVFAPHHRNTDGDELMTETKPTLSPAAQTALTTIRNLRRLSKETGTITTRAQNDILRALNSRDIAAVANVLAEQAA